MLKYVPGSLELIGTVVLPALASVFLFVLPFLDRAKTTRVRERLPWVGAVVAGVAGVAMLTGMSLRDDALDQDYQRSKVKADLRAKRSMELAAHGLPPGGPLAMLRNDPQTRGPDLYARYCSKCHVLDGEGEREAPDHTGFGSRRWLIGLLHDPDSEHYFGASGISEMESMVEQLGPARTKAVVELLFAQGHEEGDPPFEPRLVEQGAKVFEEECMDCHVFEQDGAFVFDGPNLTGWASLAWIERQIANPASEQQYGELNEMTSFEDELSKHDIAMLATYLRGQRFGRPDFPYPPIPKE